MPNSNETNEESEVTTTNVGHAVNTNETNVKSQTDFIPTIKAIGKDDFINTTATTALPVQTTYSTQPSLLAVNSNETNDESQPDFIPTIKAIAKDDFINTTTTTASPVQRRYSTQTRLPSSVEKLYFHPISPRTVETIDGNDNRMHKNELDDIESKRLEYLKSILKNEKQQSGAYYKINNEMVSVESFRRKMEESRQQAKIFSERLSQSHLIDPIPKDIFDSINVQKPVFYQLEHSSLNAPLGNYRPIQIIEPLEVKRPSGWNIPRISGRG